MVVRINRVKPEGVAQPEIELHTRWKDNWGVKITVVKVKANRVTYIRDGYGHECVCTSVRLKREFTFLQEESEKHQAEIKACGRKQIAALRHALGATGEGAK
ncbi:TPA: DUF4222 domain-containing protein [Salmonella enterica]|uniref:DUF4222 domain-containing protein n=1 Tax=Salmonella rubislaw TaxID=598 RepID=A0A5W9CPJ5_SALRU|nr:DUF4222 domain-containing protein [Salmonella enterica]EBL1805170.1 DUF4222 domain-containing protein [Salmonella enterica subsp. enterica serovar Rubislaw]EEM8340311.1 DUF4222 domain-containing protein [Salmonella enterica subsp. enterica serovar Amager]EAA8194910.1 DUF4222 domain-containing protein [Salmonella enterica]EAM9829413.1 DUF4222 domain-containing protein [Salmonella enterica]EBV5648841.1 DUF4222 domain-containing protein [Salmonella enterica subsp. enterica serovar Rubislaw]